MRHVVLVADRLFGPTAIERRARLEAANLLDEGAEVTAVTDLFGDAPDTLAMRAGFDFIDIRARGHRSVTRALSILGRTGPGVRRALRPDTDLVMCHGSVGALAALAPSHRRDIPVGLVVHSLIQDRIRTGANPSPPPSTTLYRACNRLALRWVDAVIPVSNYMADVAVALGARIDSTATLHNPIDLDRFHPTPVADKGTDVLFIGRLTIDKGIDDLLEAAEILGNEVKVDIIGTGQRRAQLEGRVSRGNVRFQGWVDNAELPDRIRAARVVVVPSRNEPQGVAVLEALACGVPVVACDVGGIPEMVEDGVSGWLVPPADPGALAARLLSALHDPRLSEVGAGARRAAERFSHGQFRARSLALHQRIVERGTGRHRVSIDLDQGLPEGPAPLAR